MAPLERTPAKVVDLSSVSKPKQKRSAETLVRILDAAESLITEGGVLDASIPEIVRRARSSVGGFYARFRDKDALLLALEERFFHDINQRLERIADPERWAAAPLHDIVRAGVHELVTTTREKKNLLAAFVVRGARDTHIQKDLLAFRELIFARMSPLFLAAAKGARHPDPERAVHLVIQMVFALMMQVVVTGEVRAGGSTLSDDEFGDELVALLDGYLGLSPRPPHRSSS